MRRFQISNFKFQFRVATLATNVGLRITLFGVAVIAVLSLTSVSAANQSRKSKSRNMSDTGLRKDVETFTKIKFTRQAEEAFRAVTAAPDDAADEPTLLLTWVQSGDWDEVREFLKQFEPEGGRRLHIKICSDLAFANPKSTMLPQDVIALADASPGELEERQIGPLGNLLKLSVKDSESRTELLALLHRGTNRLGGADADRRRMAARLLVGADLSAEAKTFGLPERDLRPGALAIENPQPDVPATPAKRTWDQLLATLRDPKLEPAARAVALDELHELFLTAEPQVIEKQLRVIVAELNGKHPDVTRLVFGMIGQKTAAAGREVDYTARAVHIELQQRAITALVRNETTGEPEGVSPRTNGTVNMLDDAPWRTLANLSANTWLVEANNSLKEYPGWLRSTASRDKHPHVPLETLISNAPAGAWMTALQSPLNSMVRVALARIILLSENMERALPIVRELVRTDSPAAAKLANSYLETWATRHDPNLSQEVLKQYRVDNQVVVLTRAQQEANLKQLGELLASLDEPTRKLLDETQLVRAFEFCHSRAEIYTREHLVEVFGTLDQITPSLMHSMTDRTRNKLASQWRDLAVQRDAATKRTATDVFELVNRGYDEAARTAEQWLTLHPDDWRMNCTVGSLLSDWAEFAYFQSVATDDSGDRFASYLKHSQQALSHFQSGAAAYAALVPKLKRSEYDLLPYRAWFYGLLGITHDGGINLRKGMTRDDIDKIRQALVALPGGASAAHIQLFSTMVADNIAANRIAPEMKYRYLSSAVHITGRQPTIYPAEEKIKYYDSLLKEIRLQTRLDGSDRIHTPGVFGVFVSLVHTTDVARESGGFSKYLMNEVPRTVSGKTIIEKPLYRDRFEEALKVALKDFFEIRSITFADPASGARDVEFAAIAGSGTRESSDRSLTTSATTGWQETPLCYLLLATKDKTVDRVPALEIELDFFDRDGKVVIPVPSNPILIEMSAEAPIQRPVTSVSLTQIVDSRELTDRRLKIDVLATAHGLVPELDQLLQLPGYSLSVQEVSDTTGLLVTELHNGPEGLYPISERSWTIALDPTPLLRGASSHVEFEFPSAKSADTQMTYRRYQDLDPVEAAARVTLVEGAEVAKVAETDHRLWIGGVVGVLVVGLLTFLALRRKPDDSSIAPPLFTFPREVTPFSVIALLHRIESNDTVPLDDEQRLALKADIHTLEQSTFSRDGTTAPKGNLDTLARRWLSAVEAVNSCGSR
ncbi:MAG: hypothetical protein ACKV2Q_08325 [Planctomycetaceae bacterium]